MRCRPARRRSGHAPCPACRASGGSSRRQERQTSAKRMKPPDGRLTTAARRCFHRGSTIGDHRRPGPWAARPRGTALQTSVSPGEPVHAGVRHRWVNGVFHLTAPIARSSRRGWGPGWGPGGREWRRDLEGGAGEQVPRSPPRPDARAAERQDDGNDETRRATRPAAPPGAGRVDGHRNGGDGAAGSPLRAACRAAGPFGAKGRATMGRLVPRSRPLAGRRVIGVPGRGRRRRGEAVARCRRSAAGPPAVPEQERRRDGWCPARGCLPSSRALRGQGNGGDEEAGRFPRSCPPAWWNCRPRPCERCDRCGAIGAPAPGARPSSPLISGESG